MTKAIEQAETAVLDTETATHDEVSEREARINRGVERFRANAARWKPGQSGNPLGKQAKLPRSRRMELREECVKAIEKQFGSLQEYLKQLLAAEPLEMFKLLVKLEPKRTALTSQTTQQLVFNVAPLGALTPRHVNATEPTLSDGSDVIEQQP